jgi:hypothetical protein
MVRVPVGAFSPLFSSFYSLFFLHSNVLLYYYEHFYYLTRKCKQIMHHASAGRLSLRHSILLTFQDLIIFVGADHCYLVDANDATWDQVVTNQMELHSTSVSNAHALV